MATINRLKDSEISSGNTASAADIDAELNQLVNEHNSKETRLDDLESNAMSIAGVKTFTSDPKMSGIDERVADAGVDVDGVVLKDSKVKPSSASPTMAEGEFGYDTATNTYKGHDGTAEVTFRTSAEDWPKGYIVGPPIEYVSTTQVKIPSGFMCRDDSDDSNIEFTGDETIDITTTTGAAVVNALMNGLSEAADTFYYVWAIAKANGADPKGLLTTSSSTISSMPTDYTLKKRIGVIRNDSSSNLLPFRIASGWPHRPHYVYRDATNGGDYQMLNGGTATTWTNVDLSDIVPPVARFADLITALNGTVSAYCDAKVREDGTSSSGIDVGTGRSVSGTGQGQTGVYTELPVSSAQIIEYQLANAGTIDISVSGFTVTD